MAIIPFIKKPAAIYSGACVDRWLESLGHGDIDNGARLLAGLARRLVYAREKHPVFARDKKEALAVIQAELDELEYAVEHESPARQHDEALDVLATAWRFLAHECGRE